MSINELKIYLDLNPKSKNDVLSKYAKKCKYAKEFELGYFFVDSEDGQCYLLDRYGEEKDVSSIHEINKDMIPIDIKKISIPNNVANIMFAAFSNCSSLTSVTIPNSVMSIDCWAFYGCSGLTSVAIPNSVTSIESFAFCNCSKLTNVTIGNNVISIYCGTFYDCSNLKSLVFKGKTIDQVKSMENYPFGVKDKSIIKAELS